MEESRHTASTFAVTEDIGYGILKISLPSLTRTGTAPAEFAKLGIIVGQLLTITRNNPFHHPSFQYYFLPKKVPTGDCIRIYPNIDCEVMEMLSPA